MGRYMLEGKNLPITIDVTVPALSEQASLGGKVFMNECARCHGLHASGSNFGPPLVHPIYRPDDHDDDAIRFAVANGVIAHHWPFGNMPSQNGVSADQVDAIITYIRELQRANFIGN